MSLSKSQKLEQVREACEADLLTYIRTVAPHRVLGAVHEDVISWWTRQEAKDNQLLLLPRGHQKSVLVAYRVAWHIVKDPTLQVLYVSATSDLAETQLALIKTVFESPVHQRLWPDLINAEEGKRERWTTTEIKVDHPLRKKEAVRDPTIKTAGLTKTITGFHADIVVLDDLVEPQNAYTLEGRNTVAKLYSQLASIENPGAKEWVVGTRYHPADLYGTLLEMEEMEYNEDGEIINETPVYEIMQRVVEIDGEFLWPRQRDSKGKYYGFNLAVLSRIKAKYIDKSQFFAQYYNDPTDPENNNIDPSQFKYYDQEHLRFIEGTWHFGNRPLAVYAGMDFAFSQRQGADWTAIVVVGIDHEGFIYVLDIDRFRTDRISTYFDRLFTAYSKWQFGKIRLEVTVAQQAIVRDLKDNYIRPNGLPLTIDEYRPNRNEGSKEERMAAVLNPRYDLGSIYHYRGGNCQVLEDELIPSKPEHDDVKDALTAAIDIAKAPLKARARRENNVLQFHSRFGGVSFRGAA